MKFIFIISFVSTIAAHSACALNDKGINEEIYNGYQAQVGQFPFIALLIQLSNDGVTSFCAGSLISTTCVLTAAHCCYNMKNTSMYMGMTDINNGTGVTKVMVNSSSYRIPTTFNITTLYNDICVICQPNPVTLTKNIKTIPLCTSSRQNVTYYDYEPVTAVGWGATNDGQAGITRFLQYTDMYVKPHSECQVFYSDVNDVQPSNICVENIDPPTGPCGGDSGGPMVYKEQNGTFCLAGCVSWGVGYCSDANPVVYTYLHSFKSWIKENAGINF